MWSRRGSSPVVSRSITTKVSARQSRSAVAGLRTRSRRAHEVISQPFQPEPLAAQPFLDATDGPEGAAQVPPFQGVERVGVDGRLDRPSFLDGGDLAVEDQVVAEGERTRERIGLVGGEQAAVPGPFQPLRGGSGRVAGPLGEGTGQGRHGPQPGLLEIEMALLLTEVLDDEAADESAGWAVVHREPAQRAGELVSAEPPDQR